MNNCCDVLVLGTGGSGMVAGGATIRQLQS